MVSEPTPPEVILVEVLHGEVYVIQLGAIDQEDAVITFDFWGATYDSLGVAFDEGQPSAPL